MQNDISTMVDSFIEGGTAVDANLILTLKKEDFQKIKATFKPTSNETFILFEVQASGLVTCSMNDNGVVAWCNISTTDINLHGENYQFFYLDKARVNKIADVCTGAVTFVIADGQLQAKIGTTDLHVSLPMYDAAVDIKFTETDSETLPSETVAALTDRLAASKSSGAFALPVMSLSDKWYFGNSQSVTITKTGFQHLKLNVSPIFFDFLSNITFTKEDVKFILDDKDHWVVISSGNVFYKVAVQEVEFDDVDPILNEPSVCEVTMDTPDTVSKLQVLSIPLIGMDNALFTLTAGDNAFEVRVRDESNRVSTDTWAVKEQKDLNKLKDTSLGIQPYLQTVNALRPDGVSLKFKETAVVFEDDGQITILLNFV